MTHLRWFILGQAAFGLLIGVFVGLSVSPVVATVIGLLFAFVGGSVLALVKGKTTEELSLIGKSIVSISVTMIVGAFIGIFIRVNGDVFRLGEQDVEKDIGAAYQISYEIGFEKIITLAKNKMTDASLCELIIVNRKTVKNKNELTNGMIDLLVNLGPLTTGALLNNEARCTSDQSGSYIAEEHGGKENDVGLYNYKSKNGVDNWLGD